MKLDEQTCTFEQGKELDSLGVREYSIFKWKKARRSDRKMIVRTGEKKILDSFEIYPAFTASELGLLIWQTQDINPEFLTPIPDIKNDWWILTKHGSKCFSAETEAEARAEVLLWLIKNEYVNPKELRL